MSDLVRPGGSPFDLIRRTDERGEHWTGRDVQPLMGYTNWRQFTVAVARARVACANSGSDPDQHFEVSLNINDHGYKEQDFRLTRYAAYLVALNGDPRKPEVAKAQSYFAIKTREAEIVQQQIPRDYAAALRAAADQFERAKVAEAKVSELETENTTQKQKIASDAPKVTYVDEWVDPRKDTTTFTVFAKQVGMRSAHQLYEELKARERIWQRVQGRRRTSKGTWESVMQWLPRAGYEHWFKVLDQPEAPELHNGQKPTTLYILPPGKVGIADLLASDDQPGGAA